MEKDRVQGLRVWASEKSGWRVERWKGQERVWVSENGVWRMGGQAA
jgi:hypothetical protein